MREYALLIGVTAPIICAVGSFLSSIVGLFIAHLAIAF